MLEFYLADSPDLGAAEPNNNKFVGGLGLEEIKWLTRFNLVKAFENNQYDPTQVESLPYFDDFQLDVTQIKNMFNRYEKYSIQMKTIPGFRSATLEKYGSILMQALEANCGLVAYCD